MRLMSDSHCGKEISLGNLSKNARHARGTGIAIAKRHAANITNLVFDGCLRVDGCRSRCHTNLKTNSRSQIISK